MKLMAGASIDVFGTGICTTVMDVLTSGVSESTIEGATGGSLYRQKQDSRHCAYEPELAEHVLCPL